MRARPQLNAIQMGMNYGEKLLQIVAFSAQSKFLSKGPFPVQEMAQAGISPVQKTFGDFFNSEILAQSSLDDMVRELGSLMAAVPSSDAKKNLAKYLSGMVVALLTGLGAGFAIEQLDPSKFAENEEVVKIVEELLTTTPSSIAVASGIGYLAFYLTTKILNKIVPTQEAEFEITPTPGFASRLIKGIAFSQLLRDVLIAAGQADILRSDYSSLLIVGLEQLTNLWHYVANTEHPVDEFTGQRESTPLPLTETEQTTSPIVTTAKNMVWNTTRLAIVLGVGAGVDKICELAMGNKEDMTNTKRSLVYGLTILAEVGTEKLFNRLAPLAMERASRTIGTFFNLGSAGERRRLLAEAATVTPVSDANRVTANR